VNVQKATIVMISAHTYICMLAYECASHSTTMCNSTAHVHVQELLADVLGYHSNVKSFSLYENNKNGGDEASKI
jgi:hypothetical protein